jgi:hypothetical protein
MDIVEIPGADFAPYIDRLLKIAGVVNRTDTRERLDSCLVMAKAFAWDLNVMRRSKIPTKELSTLETSIKKVQILLRKSEKYLGSKRIRFIDCPVGEGTVATQKFERGRRGEKVPFPPDPLPPLGSSRSKEVPDGGLLATINIQRTLERLMREIAHEKRLGRRARPREEGKRAVVAYAAKFFREYSPEVVTAYPSGKFATFCRSFYEAVTGEELLRSDALQSHIRAEVKKPRFQI